LHPLNKKRKKDILYKQEFNESLAIQESLGNQLKMYSIKYKSNQKNNIDTMSSYSKKRRQNLLNPVAFNKNELALNKLINSRQRVVKFLIILLALFILSWLPYHINAIVIDLTSIWEANSLDISDSDSISKFLVEHLFPLTLCLAFANSVTNPVCFIFFSQSLREKFKNSCFAFWNFLKCLNFTKN
jgi:hypothetical protein